MRGILIYAFDNATIDYVKQALWCADRIEHYLGLPVTIVTDREKNINTRHNVVRTAPRSGGSRIYNPTQDSTMSRWYNANRYQSWDISPYEETIVLDSDYVVCSDQLNRLFESNISVAAIKNVYDVTDRGEFDSYRWISETRSLHHYWATVLFFRKDQTSRDFFSVMQMVADNYKHYADLYGFRSTPFRNDYAVSIALTTIYGHLPDLVPEIPWSMASAAGDIEISNVDGDRFDLEYTSDKSRKRLQLQGQDFHFMNKKELAKLYEHIS